MPAISRLGDISDHGGVIITCSSDVTADGIGVARHGDLHACPIPLHGTTAMSSTCKTTVDGGRGLLRVGVASDVAGCGAIMVTGSPTVSSS